MIKPLSVVSRRRRWPRALAGGAGIIAVCLGALALVWALALDARDPRVLLGLAGAPAERVASATDEPLPQEALGPLHTGGPAAVALDRRDAVRLHFKVPPRAGLLFDLDSGEVLWRRHPLDRLPIASLTKIMTALVVVEETTSSERVKITPSAVDYAGQGVGLPKGKRVPIEGLMHGLLLVSGNDAAKALAIHVGGSERGFVRRMNRRGEALGLRCTHYVSPHGLARGDRSCAADLAAMARLAMRERRISRVVRKATAAVRFPVKGGRLFVNSTNPLLRPRRYRGTVGLKTGFTDPAGRCYVGVVRRGKRRLAVVLLHSPDPATQARKLFDVGFRRAAASS